MRSPPEEKAAARTHEPQGLRVGGEGPSQGGGVDDRALLPLVGEGEPVARSDGLAVAEEVQDRVRVPVLAGPRELADERVEARVGELVALLVEAQVTVAVCVLARAQVLGVRHPPARGGPCHERATTRWPRRWLGRSGLGVGPLISEHDTLELADAATAGVDRQLLPRQRVELSRVGAEVDEHPSTCVCGGCDLSAERAPARLYQGTAERIADPLG